MIEFHLDDHSGVPPYLQIVQQVKQALRLGMLSVGDQLPTVREVVERLVINPNTVLKAYRELEHEGVIELRHGSGAFVSEHAKDGNGRADRFERARPVLSAAMHSLHSLGLSEEEMRRLFENELNELREKRGRVAGNGRSGN